MYERMPTCMAEYWLKQANEEEGSHMFGACVLRLKGLKTDLRAYTYVGIELHSLLRSVREHQREQAKDVCRLLFHCRANQ